MAKSIGELMQRAMIVAPQQIKFEHIPIPTPSPTEVLIQVHTCALCTFEQRLYSGDEAMYPYAGGHEVSGIVAEKGAHVFGVEPGDHVALSGLYRCGECESCRRGFDNICENAFKPRAGQNLSQPAGLGQYVIRRGADCFKMPKDIPLEHAALTEPVSCVLRSVKRAGLRAGERVVIVGAGIMGLLHLQLAKSRGTIVIVSEPDEGRRRKALELGADHVLDPLEQDYVKSVQAICGGKGVDVTFICVAQTSTIEPAIVASANNGRVLCYSSFFPKGKKIEVDPNIFHKKEVVLTGTMSQTQQDFAEAAELISKKLIDLKPLISAIYPLHDLANAFKAAEGIDAYRVLVQP